MTIYSEPQHVNLSLQAESGQNHHPRSLLVGLPNSQLSGGRAALDSFTLQVALDQAPSDGMRTYEERPRCGFCTFNGSHGCSRMPAHLTVRGEIIHALARGSCAFSDLLKRLAEHLAGHVCFDRMLNEVGG